MAAHDGFDGGADLAERLNNRWKQPVIVHNIAGGEPAQLTAYLVGEKKKWQPLIQRQGIKAF